jgi:hypothetical protein
MKQFALKVACPFCSAPVNRACVDPDGVVVRYGGGVHVAREKAISRMTLTALGDGICAGCSHPYTAHIIVRGGVVSLHCPSGLL